MSPFLLLHRYYTKEAVSSQLRSSESCVEVRPNQHNINEHTSSQARKRCAQERSAETLRSNAVVGPPPSCSIAPVEQAHHSCCEREAPNRGAFSSEHTNDRRETQQADTGEGVMIFASSLSTMMTIKSKQNLRFYQDGNQRYT